MRFLHHLHRLDIQAFHLIQASPNLRAKIKFARWVSWLANGPIYLLVMLCLYLSSYAALVKVFLYAFALERALYFIFKSTFRRKRPYMSLNNVTRFIIPSDKFSFPSGHTSGAFLFSLLMSTFSFEIFCLLIPWAIGVAWARVMLGVHYPGDTLAGAILGLLTGSITIGWLL